MNYNDRKLDDSGGDDWIETIHANDQMTRFQTSELPTLNLPRPAERLFQRLISQRWLIYTDTHDSSTDEPQNVGKWKKRSWVKQALFYFS